MHILLKLSLIFILLTFTLHAQREKMNFSLVISGGVSLGAYEAGYNWAMIKMLSKIRETGKLGKPDLHSVAGASAGSINSLLSAMYWCQKDSVPLHNSIEDNLFYETWVNLGIEDLAIKGKDPSNKSTLLTRKGLRKKGKKIIQHLNKPIFRKGCEVPLGIAVTKATPIVEKVSGIKIENQHFSVPLTFKEVNGKATAFNKKMGDSTDFYISIPNIENDKQKLIDVLFASSAFPGAFQQVKLDYIYKNIRNSHYFIDGGAYDNIPLQLAIELNKKSKHFLFIDPHNMRKEKRISHVDQKEKRPLGFITANAPPLLTSLDIFQSMMLYEAINKYFKNNKKNTLILSSRFHPITGKFLEHFGAFLDKNFRVYDYHVGLYDAIYHLAEFLKKINKYKNVSQLEIMDSLKTKIGLDKHPKSLRAYKLFLETEFFHKKPKATDSFSAIYNAFNLNKVDAKRYDNQEFKQFLSKLDIQYLKYPKNSFLAYAKRDINNWYKKPLRLITNRITSLENDRAEVYPEHETIAKASSVSAWATSTLIKDKHGFEFLPLDVPQDKGKEGFRTALKFLPSEIATDMKNGGLSVGYTAQYYQNMKVLSGLEAKASYVVSNKTSDFVRMDFDVFKEYEDYLKIGAGVSLFGDMEGDFYKEDTAYGFNTYIDVLDIFRLSYVRRHGDIQNNDYFYFGIENIPSLIYWLNR